VSELVADCPRCGSKRMTFDITKENFTHVRYNWQYWFEAFCICRHCNKATIFVLSQNVDSDTKVVQKSGLVNLSVAVNRYMNIESYINLKDIATSKPPDHLPIEIEAAFREGAACMSIGCFNAAGTMFRLCIDLSTRSKLPEGDAEGLNAKVRRNLGLRLPWLFNNGLLPDALLELSTCIKEDGNDGAHVGNLTKDDAEDLLDFTYAILERLYTEPERLRLAKDRRDSRRGLT
jgi:hypothetical protein